MRSPGRLGNVVWHRLPRRHLQQFGVRGEEPRRCSSGSYYTLECRCSGQSEDCSQGLASSVLELSIPSIGADPAAAMLVTEVEVVGDFLTRVLNQLSLSKRRHKFKKKPTSKQHVHALP